MNDREMSLEEFCNKLPPFHRVNKELSALESQIKAEQESVNELSMANQNLKQWVQDLHSGMYINCVYCGHRYGPREETPIAMADVLKAHIETCPKHPLKIAKDEIYELEARLKRAEGGIRNIKVFAEEREEISVYMANIVWACDEVLKGLGKEKPC